MSDTQAFRYVGEELETFSVARHWKQYVYTQVAPFLGDRILEVGAGLGATTEMLCRTQHVRWVCLEPDETLAAQLRTRLSAQPALACCEPVVGTLQQLPHEQFDSVLYVDVLEHIEDDCAEMAAAAALLKPGGNLIVLSPAFPAFFCEFDRALGHFRRYTKQSLRAVIGPDLHVKRLRYLDSAGLFASAANRFLLHESHAGSRQVFFWDRVLVPTSRLIDPLLGYAFGRSVLGVFSR